MVTLPAQTIVLGSFRFTLVGSLRLTNPFRRMSCVLCTKLSIVEQSSFVRTHLPINNIKMPRGRRSLLSHMPSVRHLNLNRSNSSRRTLTPGITPHAGLCPSGQTGDEDEYGRKRSSSINKKITRLGSGREEGVLYTVKVAVSIYM